MTGVAFLDLPFEQVKGRTVRLRRDVFYLMEDKKHGYCTRLFCNGLMCEIVGKSEKGFILSACDSHHQFGGMKETDFQLTE